MVLVLVSFAGYLLAGFLAWVWSEFFVGPEDRVEWVFGFIGACLFWPVIVPALLRKR